MKEGKQGFIICVLVLFMCGSCFGRFVVEKNSLRVTSPNNLKDTYECAIGNFGDPQHGGILTGSIAPGQLDERKRKVSPEKKHLLLGVSDSDDSYSSGELEAISSS
ncbi:hypothetical protein LXL04_026578 [Taraxacum kok-saghyz]